MQISKAAFDLIVGFEVTSEAVYRKKYVRPEWPGGKSGLTIGIGYDVGYAISQRLRADWTGHIPDQMIEALETACGVTGVAAKSITAQLRGSIEVSWEAALAVFSGVDIPRWENSVRSHLPNTEELSSDCLGALVSLAYNRGASFYATGPRYAEMRAIQAHMVARQFGSIPAEIRAMKRLWPGDNERGLIVRREAEAKLFEKGLLSPRAAPMPAGHSLPPIRPPDIEPVPPKPAKSWVQVLIEALLSIFTRKTP